MRALWTGWLRDLHAATIAGQQELFMVEHGPVEFANQLAGQLAARSRHVCVFLGAGTARACGLPDLHRLQGQVADQLAGDEREVYDALLEGRNLEDVLTRLRRLQEVLVDGQELDRLTGQTAGELDRSICQAITEALQLNDADQSPMLGFARWVRRAEYHSPLEIFTLNYDLLLENALDSERALYFDGFVGTTRARFQTELVEAFGDANTPSLPASFARLWKLHGSVNWAWSEDLPEVVRFGGSVPQGLAAAIYPSDAKYMESRRVPFVVLMDRFRRALLQPETLLLITGYSFQDEHVNELIFDAAARRERSSFIAFCFGGIPDKVAEVALTTPALVVVAEEEAIWGGERAPWRSDEVVPGIFEEGELNLVNFRNLANHLVRGQPTDVNDG